MSAEPAAVDTAEDLVRDVFGSDQVAVIADDRDGFHLVPLDLQNLEPPEIEHLLDPYLPAGARIWAFGPAESGKSLWALSIACELTRQGRVAVFVSAENPFVEDARRLERLRPDTSLLRFFHDPGLDLMDPQHVAELVRVGDGAALIVLDTLSACWSGDEDSNSAIGALDRDVLQSLVRETGASVLVLDHTGHPQAFVPRKGVSAGRGASSKAQKADAVLVFRGQGDDRFQIEHAKNRMGGRKVPPRVFRVVDTPDGGLEIAQEEQGADSRVAEIADSMVEAVREADAGFLTTKALRVAVKGQAGTGLQGQAMDLLRSEDPPRVRDSRETVDTGQGRQSCVVWRSVGEGG